MDSWEERMAKRARERSPKTEPPDPGPMPTEHPEDAPACCFEWRLDRNHWLLFKTCGGQRPECDHQHHEGEVWLANSFEFFDGA